MKEIGPEITYLTHKLSETPRYFLDQPILINKDFAKIGKINIRGVVHDLYRSLGGKFLTDSDLNEFNLHNSKGNQNHLNIVLISCYIYSDSWFINKNKYASVILSFLKKGLFDLSQIVQYSQFISDSERREELCRHLLNGIGLRPENESVNHATDRLNTINSVERLKVVEEARKAQLKRQKEIQEAIARREAEEAASKMSRE